MKDEIWVDRYGKSMKVSDMTEEHAKNALRKLLREQRQLPAVAHMFKQWSNEQFDIKGKYPV